MNDSVRTANSGSCPAGQAPSGLVATRGDQGRDELSRIVAGLLDPLRGIERGLMPDDRDTLLINIRVSELRKIGTCLRLVRQMLLGKGEQ